MTHGATVWVGSPSRPGESPVSSTFSGGRPAPPVRPAPDSLTDPAVRHGARSGAEPPAHPPPRGGRSRTTTPRKGHRGCGIGGVPPPPGGTPRPNVLGTVPM